MTLRPAIERLCLNDERAAIFTRSGELLWRSPGWGQPKGIEHTVLGARWQEFVCELPAVLRWFQTETRRTITFKALLPVSGRVALITYAKTPLDGNWLVLGEASVIDEMLPAAPCMAPDAVSPPPSVQSNNLT